MPNRLQKELSPYLLQHAENPVDWYPWCDEALEKAKQEDRPIFLSIGYSACHWCHVMEHESFESARIAAMLNENFVSIKVDREERPDLDQLYMSAVMALRGGGGGWPLSVFLTPDQEVFFGGTYWPPESRMGMPGFDHVLTRVLHAYRENREQVDGQSAQMTKWLEEQSIGSPPSSDESELSLDTLLSAATSLRDSFDFQNGGFGSAPKFPHAMDLGLLLRMANNNAFLEKLKPEPRAELLEMVELNLQKMAYGGIFDHLAGGFARYSVDERWLVPHFEKMLYDNALLASSYMEAFRFTRNPFYSMVGRKTLDYLLNEMASPQGGYFSAEDADSEGVEGKFYVWQKAEIVERLGDEIGSRFCQLYNVAEAGNFEGSNILNMTRSYREWAEVFGMEKDALRSEMRSARQNLLEVRSHRIRPGLDDKILCSWNALAITAMCEGTLATGEQRFVESAERAFDFIWTQMRGADGQLLRVWRQGQAKQPGFLDDYAYLIDAVYSLYRATFNERYVDCGAELIGQMIEQFSDQVPGFFFTSKNGEQLIARTKDQQDNSVPSGNSMAATALLKWGRLCGQSEWIEKAWQTIQYTSSLMNRAPLATGQMLIALENYLTPSEEWVLMAPSQAELNPLLEEINQTWRPNVSLIVRSSDCDTKSGWIDEVISGKGVKSNEPTLFVCRQFSCQAPIVGQDAILQQIHNTSVSQNT